MFSVFIINNLLATRFQMEICYTSFSSLSIIIKCFYSNLVHSTSNTPFLLFLDPARHTFVPHVFLFFLFFVNNS